MIAVGVNGSAIRDAGSWTANSRALLSKVFGLRVGGDGESRDMGAGA